MASLLNPNFLLSLLISIFLSIATSESDSDLVEDLLFRQSQSKSGVIHLNDQLVTRFIVSTKTPRPYWLLIFFDAKTFHDKSELRLPQFKRDISILASSFITNNPDGSDSHGRLFFCDIDFGESQSSFALFGVNSLPHFRLVGPDVKNPKDSDQISHGDLSIFVESMSEFITSRSKLSIGPIHHPPILSKRQTAFIIALIVICSPYIAKKLWSGKTILHDSRFWLIGALFVYFFSVSGVMFNIIRKVPLFMLDQQDKNKMIFFYEGSGMQLGAEGLAVGFVYTIVGLLLAFVTHGLVRIKNATTQRVIMYLVLFISVICVKRVFYWDHWKTGYGAHAFWPKSWN